MEYLVSISFLSSPIVKKTTLMRGYSFYDPVWYMGRVQSFYLGYSLLTKQPANLKLYLGDQIATEICIGNVNYTFTISFITPFKYESILFESDFSEEKLLSTLEQEYYLYYIKNQHYKPTIDVLSKDQSNTISILKGSNFLLKYVRGEPISSFY